MTTIDLQIATGVDDASELDDGTGFTNSGVNLRIHANTTSSLRYNAGGYFANITIANAATIDVAYISVWFVLSNRDSPHLNQYLNDVDDANNFSAEADVTSRAVTTASTEWEAQDEGSGSFINGPSIVTPVQEVIDRGSWASGNAVAVILKGKSTNPTEPDTRISSYETSSAEAMKIHIEYTEATPSVAITTVDTVPSHVQSKDLTIQFTDPLWFDTQRSLTSIPLSSYSHELRAIGGYYSAKITIDEDQFDTEDWIEKGVGRHIISSNPELETIFEGFVNKISITIGALQFSIGPLVAIGNRIKVRYSTRDTSVDPPVRGEQTETPVSNNTNSQALFGIIDKVFNANSATSTEAAQIRDSILNDVSRAFPATSRKSSLSFGTPKLTLNCLGYWHWLNTYLYNNSATGEINLSDKIIAILAAEPNGIFSTDAFQIASNITQVQAAEDKDKKPLTVLKYLNSLGDAANARYNMGFYENRVFKYEVAPTEIAYYQRITGNQGITTSIGGKVDSWNVLPAKWLFYPDFLVGRHPPITSSTLSSDPRAGFIETVKFNLPDSLSINGGKFDESDVLLERLGLKGTS